MNRSFSTKGLSHSATQGAMDTRGLRLASTVKQNKTKLVVAKDNDDIQLICYQTNVSSLNARYQLM